MKDSDSKRDAMPTRYFFVYGTLRQRYQNRYARLLRRHAHWLGIATTRGALYICGHSPALVKRNRLTAHPVQGDLYRIDHRFASIWRQLDAYEECEKGVYTREIRRVRLNGRALYAWMYVYQRQVRLARRIPSGNIHDLY